MHSRSGDHSGIGVDTTRDVDGEHRRVGRNRRNDLGGGLAQTARATDADDAVDHEVGVLHRIRTFDPTTRGLQRGKPRDVGRRTEQHSRDDRTASSKQRTREQCVAAVVT